MGEDEEREFASPPCSLSEVDPAYAGLDGIDLKAWRKAERTRLIEARMAILASERAQLDVKIIEQLEELIGDPQDWW